MQRTVLVVLFCLQALAGAAASRYEVTNPLDLLPPESTMLLTTDVTQMRSVVAAAVANFGRDSRQVTGMVDRSSFVAVALRTQENLAEPGITVIAEGRFPYCLLRWRLRLSPLWRSQRTPAAAGDAQYWYSSRARAEIAAPRRELLLVSNGDMPLALRRLGAPSQPVLPAELEPQIRQTGFTLFVPELGLLIGDNATLARFPLQSLWVTGNAADQSEEGGHATFLLQSKIILEAPRHAVLFAVFARATVALVLRQLHVTDAVQRLREVTVAVENNTVLISGLQLSAQELVEMTGLLVGPSSFTGGQNSL